MKISTTMQAALDYMRANNGMRYYGGLWANSEFKGRSGQVWFGTTTIEAMEKRGLVEWCEWKTKYGQQFAVKARIKTTTT